MTVAKKPGRPPKDVREREVRNLAKVGCTDDEIAALLDCGETTIKRRFGPALKRGRAEARVSLRREQFQLALAGNVTMLIWLGKQLLGQKNDPNGDAGELVAPPCMIEMAARMDASIPMRKPPENGNGNGAIHHNSDR